MKFKEYFFKLAKFSIMMGLGTFLLVLGLGLGITTGAFYIGIIIAVIGGFVLTTGWFEMKSFYFNREEDRSYYMRNSQFK